LVYPKGSVSVHRRVCAAGGGTPSSRERAAAGGPAGRVHGPIFKTLIYYHNLFHERYLVTEFNTPSPT